MNSNKLKRISTFNDIKKIFILYFPLLKDKKVDFYNNISDSEFNVTFVKYLNKLDNNKINSLLNEKYDNITIIIDRKLLEDELETVIKYIKSIKNKENIMIIYKNSLPDYSKKFSNLNLPNSIIKYMPSKYHYYTNKFGGILITPFQDFSKLKEIDLSKTWFYRYIIKKLFSCGTGRLRQISGTCYANAVMNSILLSKSLKGLFFLKLNRDLQKDKINIKDINKPINEDCPADNRTFIYRFLYNLTCTDFTSKVDFYYKDAIKNPDNIMTKITKKIVDNDIYEYFSQIFSDNLFKDVFGKYYNSDYNSYPYKYQGKTIYFPMRARLLHPIDKESCLKIDYGHDSTINIEYHSGYNPIACVIFVQSDTLKNFNHLICGYICNGKYMLYDSGNNYLEEFNWTNTENLRNLKVQIDHKNFYHFVSFICIYHIKTDYIHELENTKLC